MRKRAPRISSLFALVAAAPGTALAAPPPPPTTHVVYVATPGAPDDPAAQRRFQAATLRYGLGPLEVVDLPAAAASTAPARLTAARAHLDKLRFGEAVTELDAAAREVEGGGSRGLDRDTLSDIYLLRAWGKQRAGSKVAGDAHVAWPDYLRACSIAPRRQIPAKRYPPAVAEQWQKARAEIARRGTSSLVVRARPGALASVSIDGAALVPVPATVPKLAQGEHLVRIEEPGFPPWGAIVPLGAGPLEVEAPPRPPLAVDEAQLAAQAQKTGAPFVLVGQLRVPSPKPLLDVRLIDVRAASTRDAAVTGIAAEDGSLENTVMRLDEEARRVTVARSRGVEPPAPAAAGGTPLPLPSNLAAPPPDAPRPRVAFDEDPLAWSRDHWPLMTAVAVMVGMGLVLSYQVATSEGR